MCQQGIAHTAKSSLVEYFLLESFVSKCCSFDVGEDASEVVHGHLVADDVIDFVHCQDLIQVVSDSVPTIHSLSDLSTRLMLNLRLVDKCHFI